MNWLRKIAGLKPYWSGALVRYIVEPEILRSDDEHIDDDIEKNEENLWSTSITDNTEDNTMSNDEIDCSNEKTVRARAFQIAAAYGNNVDIGDGKKEWKNVNIIRQIEIAKNIFDWIWNGLTLNIDETQKQKETEDKGSPIEENQEHKDNTND